DVRIGDLYVVEFHFQVSGLEGQSYDARAGEHAQSAADLFEQDGETVDEEDVAGVGGGQQFVGVEGLVGRGYAAGERGHLGVGVFEGFVVELVLDAVAVQVAGGAVGIVGVAG